MNIESNTSLPSHGIHVAYKAESQMLHPKRFLRAAIVDMRGAWPTTKRLFRRAIAQRYRYSSLGIVWAFAPSAITALVLILGQNSKFLNNGGVPPAFYGVFGLALGQTFLEALNNLRTIFSGNQMLMRRNNVHIEGLIAAAIVDAAFSTLVRLVILTAAFIFFHIVPAITIPLALCGFLGTLLVGAGIGLFLAPFSSLKRDIENIMNFLPWVIFATTPVFIAPAKASLPARIYAFNPLAWIFDSTRSLAYEPHPYIWPAVLGLVVGSIMTIAGWLMCRLWRPYVVERSLV